MSPEVFREFEHILAARDAGERILEIGAVPTSDSLLNIKSLATARERIGINLDGGESYKFGNASRANEYRILKANSNDMSCFPDDRFDTILCNSVLEHDRYFWKTIAEIRRVCRNGGLIVIGTPGYDDLENVRLENLSGTQKEELCRQFRIHFPGTPTLGIHDWPGDYYRFSPQAFREVIFEDMRDVEIRSIMIPPRIIGLGFNVK